VWKWCLRILFCSFTQWPEFGTVRGMDYQLLFVMPCHPLMWERRASIHDKKFMAARSIYVVLRQVSQ